ncbi:MAG: NAD-dependent epimerase/dehydratase family protein, partial [Myxococcota bacterium]
MTGAKGPSVVTMPRVLVTGASGFLGKYVVNALCAPEVTAGTSSGAHVRALVRRPALHLDRLGIQSVLGDIANESVCTRALDGIDTVYHLAGLVSRRDEDASAMYRVHVDGTRCLLRAAAAARVRRVIVVSTSGTLAVSVDAQTISREDTPLRRALVSRWPYYLSKIYQEETALEIAAATGLDIVILNPSLLLGPGDERSSSTRDVENVVRGRLPVIPRGGGVSFVDVRDVATMCLAAAERGRKGERYLLGAANMTLEGFLGRVARLAGRAAPRPWVSSSALLRAGRLLDGLGRLWGGASVLDRQSVEMAEHY